MDNPTYVHSEDVHNFTAARIILPLIFDLIGTKSLIDVGCGIGTWLKVAKDLGVSDILGVDGDYVDRKVLSKYIDEDNFLARDLTKPLELYRTFDLALCLEVAEHLPFESADILIDSLCNHSGTILFSAAIPFQGGQNHLNEQTPNYWIGKFEQRGFQVYDPIRSAVWERIDVDVWYKQNILLFSTKELSLPKPIFTHVVHPELFEAHLAKKNQYMAELKKIKDGKVNSSFYLKNFFKSIFR
jgi:SAM-dependent methyltransferase